MLVISSILCLEGFVQCTSSNSREKEIEKKALYLANHIDSISLNQLNFYSYGAKDDDNFWLRVSGDTNLYICNYKINGDTAKFSVWQPYKLERDFTTNFFYDTSLYSQFTFSNVNGTIVQIELDSSKGNTYLIDTSVNTQLFFPGNNPFHTFSGLTSIAKKYQFIGSSYSSNLGHFYIFWLSPIYKLLYIPDSLKIEHQYRRQWINEYNRGKVIKPHWSLINIYKK